jgi:hypothetical protein
VLFGAAPLQARQVGAERGVAPNRRGAGHTRGAPLSRAGSGAGSHGF